MWVGIGDPPPHSPVMVISAFGRDGKVCFRSQRVCSGAVVYLYGAGGFQSMWGVKTRCRTSGELHKIAAHPVAHHTQGFDGSSIIS